MTASSTGTAEGARTGLVKVILVSGDWDVMALYLGSRSVNRKGHVVPAKAGTHNHRAQFVTGSDDHFSQAATSRGMGPGSALAPLACPGRQHRLVWRHPTASRHQ